MYKSCAIVTHPKVAQHKIFSSCFTVSNNDLFHLLGWLAKSGITTLNSGIMTIRKHGNLNLKNSSNIYF